MKKYLSYLVLIFSIFHYQFSVFGQVRPVYDYGAIGLGQLLKKLNNTKSVMMIGAHPDDEDSALLAYLARGENARTAYLSLTRGDGGQNLLGDELYEPLGVIRTEELLQARRLDGAEQFFTRAFDYGFSKTLDEAKSKWDEKTILCDTVKAIRQFRPLVVISRFSGTPADGHGQHQFAGYISPLAVKAAADVNQCKDAGQPWQVQKFYVGQSFRSTNEPSLKINTGKYDYLLGRSYFEIAMEGRSQHKTQEQGVLELKGERFSGLNLIDSKVANFENESNVFEGIDTSVSRITEFSSDVQETVLKTLLNILQKKIEELSENKLKREEKLSSLIESEKLASSAISAAKSSHSRYLIFEKIYEIRKAIQIASGLQIDALASRETVAPEEIFQTNVKIYYPDNTNYKIKNVKINAPENWQISKIEPPKEQSQSFFGRETPNESAFFSVKVPNNANPTQPFWLDKPRTGDLFVWEGNENQNLPFQKPLLTAEITAELDGVELKFSQPVEFRFADDIRGEIRREVNVVPKITLEFDRKLTLVSDLKKTSERELTLKIKNNSESEISGKADLKLPENWSAVSDRKTFTLKKGEQISSKFIVKIPGNFPTGSYEVKAEFEANNEKFTQTLHTISYPHIQTHRYYTDAKTNFNLFDLKVAPLRVGYIQGSGDKVPQAIKQMGLNVTMLDESYLSTGDLSKFDTIVVGVRASQTRPDFVANNKRLSDFMTNGGTLIVQYQQYEYVRANLPPFPAKMDSNIRTVDENAPVKILAPEHPVFNFPNKIREKDFDGWVQERNLYTFTSFDEKYTPLLETHDAGEAESKGGMVYAEVGKGKYVYTAYSFFRQLPAGNQGAFRLFANLLSLPKSGK